MELTIDRLPKGVAVLDLHITDEREILDQLPALAGWLQDAGAERNGRDAMPEDAMPEEDRRA